MEDRSEKLGRLSTIRLKPPYSEIIRGISEMEGLSPSDLVGEALAKYIEGRASESEEINNFLREHREKEFASRLLRLIDDFGPEFRDIMLDPKFLSGLGDDGVQKA